MVYKSSVLDKWKYNQFQSSCSTTKEFTSFCRNIKKFIKDETNTCFELISFNKGHFYFSGFLQNRVNGKYVYFCCSDVRYFTRKWYNALLIRTANNDKDFTGGTNHDCNINDINDKSMSLSH